MNNRGFKSTKLTQGNVKHENGKNVKAVLIAVSTIQNCEVGLFVLE